jgi:hypothetical protein
VRFNSIAPQAGQLPPPVRAGLADPSARIAVTTVTRDGGRRLDCYAVAGAGKQLAAVTPDAEGGAAVSFPVDGALAESLVVETLGLDQPLAPVDHRSELDIAALWALAAMADAHRQAELESLLARTPARQVAINEDSIYLRALDGATLPDPRWLSGMLTQIFGPGDVTEARLLAGLDLLARGRLIARGKRDCSRRNRPSSPPSRISNCRSSPRCCRSIAGGPADSIPRRWHFCAASPPSGSSNRSARPERRPRCASVPSAPPTRGRWCTTPWRWR